GNGRRVRTLSSYEVRPVAVQDVARLCVEAGEADDKRIVDAVGPDMFSFEEMVRRRRRRSSGSGSHRRFVGTIAEARFRGPAQNPAAMYDVIVVGARAAGSPTAMLLARRGYRVLLVDKARFPKDTVSTLYIHQPGLACLQRWGLLDRLRATGCPSVGEISWDLGPVGFRGRAPAVDRVADVLVPRRTVLDPLLAEAA